MRVVVHTEVAVGSHAGSNYRALSEIELKSSLSSSQDHNFSDYHSHQSTEENSITFLRSLNYVMAPNMPLIAFVLLDTQCGSNRFASTLNDWKFV